MQKYFAFIKTVELGSFTKAAEILNYSQSGISRMISDLEKEDFKEFFVNILDTNIGICIKLCTTLHRVIQTAGYGETKAEDALGFGQNHLGVSLGIFSFEKFKSADTEYRRAEREGFFSDLFNC